jgi:hypothetical protein
MGLTTIQLGEEIEPAEGVRISSFIEHRRYRRQFDKSSRYNCKSFEILCKVSASF